MAETPEARKARHERYKARMASDPEFAVKHREQSKQAKKKYEAKKRFQRASSGPVGSGKPGRLVARMGWEGW
jgi:hypothetical protein